MPVSLSSSLYLLQQYGPVAPSTLTQPVRPGLGKYGDGLFVEEGTTNLVTNPSFETGTAGASSAGTIVATLATSTARAFIGSQSLLVTPGAGTGGTSGVNLAATPVPVTAATTYAVSLRVWVPAGAPAFNTATVGDNATAPVTAQLQYAGANVAGQTLPKQQWVTLTGTITTGAGATQINAVTLTLPGGSSAFYVDAVQVEQKGYATSYCDGSLGAGYAWTGAANASTSTRAAGQVTHPVPSTLAPLTVCAWVRVGEVTGAVQDVVSLSGGTGGISPQIQIAGNVQFSSSVDVAAAVSYTPTAGDLLFIAGTLAADGKTYSLFLSRNGGAVTSATSAASATAYSGATTVTPGSAPNAANSSDSVVEQVLVYNRALTPTEVSTLAFNASESTFASDPGIVYAAACGPLRGTTSAHTLNGTGLYRAATSSPIACYVEPVPAFGPDAVAGATKKISVAAGSGIGQGQLVSLNAATGGNVSTVLRVFSPGGDYDELYTT